jgi:hypothetical protein
MAKHRTGSKRRMIEDLIIRGLTARQIFNELLPLVQNQMEPMIFKANEHGTRVAKPLSSQVIELRNEINRTFKAVQGQPDGTLGDRDVIPEPIPAEEIPAGDTPEEEPAPIVASGKARFRNELEKFKVEIRRIRKWCKDRAEAGSLIDEISVRPSQAAARLIPMGIPADALLAACCMHWDDDAKRMAGIPSFDFVAFSRTVMRERNIPLDGTYHELFGYALLLAEARQPIFLVGPMGTGKSTLLRQLAAYLELDYAETPMTPGATRGDLLGRHTASSDKPFIPSEFTGIYGGGGLFNFEEIDASDPAMLIVLNGALASDTLYNSASGERVSRHADCILAACGNTFGTGANRQYTGRERLDAASLDRFRMGRLFIPLDENIEDKILDAAL